jgi:hypothetical protein
MIHYTCDCCKRIIDPNEDVRYTVKMEVYASPEGLGEADFVEERDHLEELTEILDQLADDAEQLDAEETCTTMRFDLCPECQRRFVKNPLGRETSKQLNFSQN